MNMTLRACSMLLAVSLALPTLAPTRACAGDDDPTNEIVAFGVLGAVIGIVAYLGWRQDKEDEQQKTESILRKALADTGSSGRFMLVAPSPRAGEATAGLGYGLAF